MDTVKVARKLSYVAISQSGKIDTYRQVVNKVKHVCCKDKSGTKEGATLTLYTRFIVNEQGALQGQVFCNKSLTQAQADTYWVSLS